MSNHAAAAAAAATAAAGRRSISFSISQLVPPPARNYARSLPKKGDVKRINDIAVRAPCTGMIIVGGGLVKHHVCNANLMRNGADFAVFMNTGAGKLRACQLDRILSLSLSLFVVDR